MRTFRVANCDESIGSIKVKLRGKLLAWVVKTFMNIEELIKGELNGKVCSLMIMAFNDSNKERYKDISERNCFLVEVLNISNGWYVTQRLVQLERSCNTRDCF